MNYKPSVYGLMFLVLTACGGGGGENPPPANSAPTAVITASKTSGYGPLTVAFDGSQSSDRDGNVTNYSWDFGDGTSSLGSQANHTYTSLGLFTATLTVTDDDGAESSASVSINSHVQAAGHYLGSFVSDVTNTLTSVEAIIGTNHEIHAWDYVNFDAVYWGNLDVLEQIVSGTISAEIWNPPLVFPNGSTFGTVSIAGDVAARQRINGVFSGVGDTGTINLQYIPEVSERPSSLSDVSGVWTYSDGAGFTETVTITNSGSLALSASDGCTAQGQLTVLDPLLNGFSFEYDLTCPPGVNVLPNGVRTGIAFIDDFFFADVWLVAAGSIGNNGTLVSWSRPRSTAIGRSGIGAGKISEASPLAQRRPSRR